MFAAAVLPAVCLLSLPSRKHVCNKSDQRPKSCRFDYVINKVKVIGAVVNQCCCDQAAQVPYSYESYQIQSELCISVVGFHTLNSQCGPDLLFGLGKNANELTGRDSESSVFE